MGVQEKLVINNFFSIKEFHWDIKDFNILTGGMASGKSLCLKLIHFIEQVFNKNIFFASISRDSLTRDIFYNSIADQFNNVFHSMNHESDFLNTSISYSCTNAAGNIVFDLRAAWDRIEKKLKWESNYINERIADWQGFLGDNNTPDAARSARLQIYENIVHDFSGDFPFGVLFIPASRAIAAITNKADIPDVFLSTFIGEEKPFVLRFDDKISNKYVNNMLHLKKVIVDIKNKDKTLEFVSGNGKKITPLELSSGQQELLYLLLLIKNLPDTTFNYGKAISIFIEEPSAHLFPQEQKDSIEYIVKIFRALQARKERFFITTHSPYILNTINNVIKKGNMLKEFPASEEEINNKIAIPHLFAEEISANYIEKDGTVTDMMDRDNGYLNADKIAEISFSINEDTNKLLDLNNKLVYETEKTHANG
jgi:predicted ATPase